MCVCVKLKGMAISDKSTDKERQVLQETTKCKISEQSQKKLSAWDRSLKGKVIVKWLVRRDLDHNKCREKWVYWCTVNGQVITNS